MEKNQKVKKHIRPSIEKLKTDDHKKESNPIDEGDDFDYGEEQQQGQTLTLTKPKNKNKASAKPEKEWDEAQVIDDEALTTDKGDSDSKLEDDRSETKKK